jgi:glucose-6-phosphate 1-epimerase
MTSPAPTVSNTTSLPDQTPFACPIEHNGHAAVLLRLKDGSQAVVLQHGAHVVSWQAAGWDEQLYVSPLAKVEPGKAIRGGVPVIFPQFEQRGPDTSLPRHGFARTSLWQLDVLHAQGEQALCTMVLQDNEATRAIWPHRFLVELTVALSPARLDIELHIENTDDHAWSFAAALHTYLRVSELSQVRLQGLEGCRFIEAKDNSTHTEDHPEKRFAGHVDRIYKRVPANTLLRDSARVLTLNQETFEDLVVWNPGPELCKDMSDMPDADWAQMLCVEAAQVARPPLLAPGEQWTARQSLVLPQPLR